MRRVPRRRLQRQTDDLRDLVIADLTRRAWTGLVQKALHTTLREAPPPLADGVGRCADPRADVLILHPFPASKTIRARWARPCAVRRRDAKLPSSRRSLSLKSTPTAVLPIAILHANPRADNRIYLSIRTLVLSERV